MRTLAFIVMMLLGTTFQSAHAQAIEIYGKKAVIGFARLQSDESIEGCGYRRLSGTIAHINRNTNGVRVDGFALSLPSSSVREYINVGFERLPRLSASNFNQTLTDSIGRKIDIVIYGCGASGGVQLLDEIVFR